MTKFDRRLQKLESTLDPAGRIVFLTLREGESMEDCIRRSGHDPATSNASIVFMDEVDWLA